MLAGYASKKHIPDCNCQPYSLTLSTVGGLVRRTDGNWAGTTYKLPSLVCVSLCGNAKKACLYHFPVNSLLIVILCPNYVCTKKVVFRTLWQGRCCLLRQKSPFEKGQNISHIFCGMTKGGRGIFMPKFSSKAAHSIVNCIIGCVCQHES